MKIKTVSIDADVEQVVRQAKLDGNNLTLQGQLTPQMYKKVMKVLELIGFKWNRSAKCHIGEGDSADKLREALGTGKVVNEKQTYQFFATPERLASRMVSLASIEKKHSVLEPSAGKGAILDAIRSNYNPAKITACEINPSMVDHLDKMHGGRVVVVEGDFIQVDLEKHDRIVMNPPFTGGQDVAHVKHAYGLLNGGGRLVAIMSRGWQGNSDRRSSEFRKWYAAMQDSGLASIPEILEGGTFKESGTNIETVLVVIQKP